MSYTIRKEFSFSASHQLSGLPPGHSCSRLHGHNYVVAVEMRSRTLTGPGFVRDYRELDEFKKHLDAVCDHRHLNDYMPDDTESTAENLARLFYQHLADYFPELLRVGVSETPKTWAYYEKG